MRIRTGKHVFHWLFLLAAAVGWLLGNNKVLAFAPPSLTTRYHPTRSSSSTKTSLPLFKTPPPPPPPAPSAAAVLQQQIVDLAKHSTVAGKFRLIRSKLTLTPRKLQLILGGISHAVNWEEVLFFYFFGWWFVPLLEIPQNYVREKFFQNARPFKRSTTKLVADHISQLSKIGFVVYMVDILKVVLQAMGFKFAQLQRYPHIAGKTILTLWIFNRVSALKRYYLALKTRNDPTGELLGSAELVDRLIDAILYGVGAFVLIDSLQTDFGAAAKGFAALGGLSTIVLSLASQGLVSQVFYGLFLATSNKVRKGDVISFGHDGKLKGLIANQGWTDTLIRAPDGVMVSVPNKELADKTISNLSRIQISSVKQELRFRYSDADKLPKVLEDIKEEIRAVCPDVIDDGSRPFRAYWTGYGTVGLEVTVEAHFRIKLLSDDFWRNRQQMLLAIHRAVKQNRAEFALIDDKTLESMYKGLQRL